MSVTKIDVLRVLNMEESEFLDGVLDLQISSAVAIVEAKNKGGATGKIVEIAILRLSAYYSYLAYSDDPKNRLPGSIDPNTGVWTPVADPAMRVNMDPKLKALKAASDDAIETMQESVSSPLGIMPSFGVLRIK